MLLRVMGIGVSGLLLALLSGTRSSAQSEAGQAASPPAPVVAAQAQEPSRTASPAEPTPVEAPDTRVLVPTGTHLPLVLRNGVNTRTAKAGDAVYFETLYPISLNNRIAIPMGTFVRGQILTAKRPGRISGRGEFRIALEQMTFSNGYTIELRATPSSVDRDGREGVDAEGKIKGPGSVGKDVGLVAIATGGGAYIGTLAGALNGAAGRGALIGGGAAGVATLIAILATRGPEAELPRGTTMDVVFDRPLILDPAYLPTNTAGVDPQRLLPPPEDERRRRAEGLRERMAHRPLGFPFPLVR